MNNALTLEITEQEGVSLRSGLYELLHQKRVRMQGARRRGNTVVDDVDIPQLEAILNRLECRMEEPDLHGTDLDTSR